LKAAGVDKGSAVPHKTKVANITMAQVKEIAMSSKLFSLLFVVRLLRLDQEKSE
jgi:ribosomal protein L11